MEVIQDPQYNGNIFVFMQMQTSSIHLSGVVCVVFCVDKKKGNKYSCISWQLVNIYFQEPINVISAELLIAPFDNTLNLLCACGVLFIYCTSFEIFAKEIESKGEDV